MEVVSDKDKDQAFQPAVERDKKVVFRLLQVL